MWLQFAASKKLLVSSCPVVASVGITVVIEGGTIHLLKLLVQYDTIRYDIYDMIPYNMIN